MAQNPKISEPYQSITAAGKYELGDAADAKIVTTHLVHLIPQGLSGGAITVKSRAAGTIVETKSGNGGVPVSYLRRYLNGAVSDDTLTSAQITSESLILIPSTGQVPILDVATVVAGTWDVFIVRTEGAAA